jgi:hypothetical protein
MVAPPDSTGSGADRVQGATLQPSIAGRGGCVVRGYVGIKHTP